MGDPLEEAQDRQAYWMDRVSGNHQGWANDVSEVNGEHRFGTNLHQD